MLGFREPPTIVIDRTRTVALRDADGERRNGVRKQDRGADGRATGRPGERICEIAVLTREDDATVDQEHRKRIHSWNDGAGSWSLRRTSGRHN